MCFFLLLQNLGANQLSGPATRRKVFDSLITPSGIPEEGKEGRHSSACRGGKKTRAMKAARRSLQSECRQQSAAIGFNNGLGALICVGICFALSLSHSALRAGCTDADGEADGGGGEVQIPCRRRERERLREQRRMGAKRISQEEHRFVVCRFLAALCDCWYN